MPGCLENERMVPYQLHLIQDGIGAMTVPLTPYPWRPLSVLVIRMTQGLTDALHSVVRMDASAAGGQTPLNKC